MTNVTLMVKDMEKSISFYQSIGLTLAQRWENFYAQLSAPGIKIGLHPNIKLDQTRGSGNVSVGFTVDEFDEAKGRLDELSIEVQSRKEEGGEFLHFNDPDGTALYFIRPKG